MTSIIIAVILDWILGDPYNFPHPVRLMGNIINFEEKIFRKISSDKKELFLSGLVLTLINVFLGIVPIYFIMKILPYPINIIFESVIFYYCISGKMLDYEASEVKKALESSVEEGRERLKYIVGRDTKYLDQDGIIKATVETVSENTSDGIIAPLFYIFFFGPVGGITYKFINTMDSMIGYKNEKYEDLGKSAAILDDIVNFIPARITGILMCFYNLDLKSIKKNFSIMKKYHKAHTSPNAGYPESAVASILGIELGGGNYYYGKYVEKPIIGKKEKEVEIEDIDKTIKIMYKTEIYFLILLGMLYIIF